LNQLASEPEPKPRAGPGQRLGPCELLAPLGVGGMSEVCRARDGRLGREVAAKILDLEAARHPERLRLFEQEARAAGAIDHPAIVTVHDVGREGDLPYVVFELVEGETLQRRLDRGRARALRLELATGERTLWREFSPADSAGVVGTIDPTLTPDGSAWAYSILRHLNDLYVVEGLR
jgi:Protein kinase domain